MIKIVLFGAVIGCLCVQNDALEFTGVSPASIDLLDYAKHRNVQGTFPSPFLSTPSISLTPAASTISVSTTVSNFSAFAGMVGKGRIQIGETTVFPGADTSNVKMIGERIACVRSGINGVEFLYSGENVGDAWQAVQIDGNFDFTQPYSYPIDPILFLVSGHPAVVYGKPGFKGVQIAVSQDLDGKGLWTCSGVELPTTEYGLPLSAGEVNGRPALAYVDDADFVSFAVSEDASGRGPWKRNRLERDDAPMIWPGLGVIDGRPAVLCNQGPALYLFLARDPEGTSGWSKSLISTNGWGASITLINGDPVVAFVAEGAPFCDDANCWTDRFIEIAKRVKTDTGDRWEQIVVGPGDGLTTFLHVDGREIISYYWRHMAGGGAGAFIATSASLDHWLDLPDRNGKPGRPTTVWEDTDQLIWVEWKGKPMLLLGGPYGDRDTIYGFDDLNWRATEGVQGNVNLGHPFFVEAANSPYKVGQSGGWVGRDIHLTLADFNQNGRQEIAVANYRAGTCEILEVNSSSWIESLWLKALPFAPAVVAAGDLNSDGRLDLVVSGYDARTDETRILSQIFLNASNTLILHQDFPRSDLGGFDEVVFCYAADLNQDGKLDLVQVSRGAVTTAIADGAGKYKSAAYPALRPDEYPIASDVNADGIPDVLILGSGAIQLFLSNGAGGFTSSIVAPASSPGVFAAGDLNGDGFADFLTWVGHENSPMTLNPYFGDGQGNFKEGPPIPQAKDPFGVAMMIVDADGDGRMDIVRSLSSGGVEVLLNHGNMNFSPAPGSPFGSGTYQSAFALGDVNGDGMPDLVIGNADAMTVQVFLGGGHKTAVHLDFVGVAGQRYRIESCDALGGQWKAIATLPAALDGRFQFSHQSASAQSFYRAYELGAN